MSRFIAVLSAIVAALALAPVASAAVDPSETLPAPALAWGACPADVPADLSCATVSVPLDYGAPSGRQIPFMLSKRAAGDPARRIGTVWVNPGGPGGPGLQTAASVARLMPAVAERFDIIGFDPRGIGRSAEVRCFTDPAEAESIWLDLPPANLRQEWTYIARMRDYARACGRHNGDLLRHTSTANVARDMNLLRRSMGEDTISLYGVSYATHLGMVFANMFPDRVRAFALDGVVDPELVADHPIARAVEQATDTERTLDVFTERCAAEGPQYCALARAGSTAGTVRATIDSVLARLKQGPIAGLTYQDGVTTLGRGLYGVRNWPAIAELFAALASDSPVAAATAAAHPGLQAADELVLSYFDGLYAVQCADGEVDVNPLAFPALNAATSLVSPHGAGTWLYLQLPCASWPVPASSAYTGPWNRPTPVPLLLVTTTADPATPYRGAVRAAQRLGNARLLVVDGPGHGSGSARSSCALDAKVRYLVELALPAAGARCGIDAPPFR